MKERDLDLEEMEAEIAVSKQVASSQEIGTYIATVAFLWALIAVLGFRLDGGLRIVFGILAPSVVFILHLSAQRDHKRNFGALKAARRAIIEAEYQDCIEATGNSDEEMVL